MSDSECIICEKQILHRTLLPCGHSSICFPCFLTLTHCYHQNYCPICQIQFTQDPIVLSTPSDSNYQEEFSKNYPHDDTHHFYYSDPSILSLVQDLLQFHCPVCGTSFASFDKFSEHLSKHPKEHLTTCKICNESQRFLPCNYPIFPSNSEIAHSHFLSHPTCPVCPYHAFDHHSLEQHCQTSHVRCNICITQGQIHWFLDHSDLYQHCKKHHFVCPHPSCDAAFGDSLELQIHLSEVHKEQFSFELSNTRNSELARNKAIETEEIAMKNLQIKQRKKQLKQIANNDFQDKSKTALLFDLLKKLNEKTISPTVFLEQYDQLCGEWAHGLFIHTAAAIENSQIRAEIVKMRLGSGSCALRKRRAKSGQNELFPSLPVDKPQESPELNMIFSQSNGTNNKKRGKKIVLSSF